MNGETQTSERITIDISTNDDAAAATLSKRTCSSPNRRRTLSFTSDPDIPETFTTRNISDNISSVGGVIKRISRSFDALDSTSYEAWKLKEITKESIDIHVRDSSNSSSTHPLELLPGSAYQIDKPQESFPSTAYSSDENSIHNIESGNQQVTTIEQSARPLVDASSSQNLILPTSETTPRSLFFVLHSPSEETTHKIKNHLCFTAFLAVILALMYYLLMP